MKKVLLLLLLAGIVLAATQTASAQQKRKFDISDPTAVAPNERDITPPTGGGNVVIDGDYYYYYAGVGCFRRAYLVPACRVVERNGVEYVAVRVCGYRYVYVRAYPYEPCI